MPSYYDLGGGRVGGAEQCVDVAATSSLDRSTYLETTVADRASERPYFFDSCEPIDDGFDAALAGSEVEVGRHLD